MEPKQKQCPSCGKTFTCYANTGMKCWCEEYDLGEETLKYLEKTFADCLCPECLPQYSKPG